ncbi:hypothetical protein LRP30_32380 [Bradyrhizobium sp. C-145]|uniref:hypothetical protein n=1 Tax=Bradyrhizobium sp. C-145 TaxID=574727 RepID=UPI00201B734E|nr:hypothetical protein [Bradyrhizobium sp. C-145]UQR61513.1 hypothetical protein LRP30_32380 [Bradyrhizobium sp. C-145]
MNISVFRSWRKTRAWTLSLRASQPELMGIALGMKDAGSGEIEFMSDFNTPNPKFNSR